MLEKRSQVPNPFKIIFVPFILKGDKPEPKGFGIRPLVFHVGPRCKKWGQVRNSFKIISAPFILKGAKLVPKGFGTWTMLFHFGPCWKEWVRFQTLLKSFWPLSFWKGSSWYRRRLEPDPCFSTESNSTSFLIILAPFILKGVLSFWKALNWYQRGLEPDFCFSTLVHVGKMVLGSNPF